MNLLRVYAAIAGFIALGYLLCPVSTQTNGVSAPDVLKMALNADHHEAVQQQTWHLYGKTYKRQVRVHITPYNGACTRLIKKNYIPLIEGSDIVAGRQAWTLRLKPVRWNDIKLPWKQLWVDKETGVILASRDWSSGDMLRNSMVTLSVKHIPQSPDISPNQAPHIIPHPSIPRGVVLPKYMPGGFQLIGINTTAHPGRTHLEYTNGLYALSIYEERGDKTVANAVSDWGMGLIVSRQAPLGTVTVIGDLRRQELMKIVDSVEFL